MFWFFKYKKIVMWCNKMCYEFDPIYHDAFNHICKFQSNCFWTLPFWQLMTSLQSYQSVTKHTKNVDVQIMYVPVCKTYCPYIKFTQNMNNFCSFIIFFPYQSDPNSTTMIGLVKHLSAPTSYKRKFVMSGGITPPGNTVIVVICTSRGGVNIT